MESDNRRTRVSETRDIETLIPPVKELTDREYVRLLEQKIGILGDRIIKLESRLLIYEPFGSINASDTCEVDFPIAMKELLDEVEEAFRENLI